MKNLTLSVTQINNYIKNIFNAEEMLIGVSIFGEITNYKPTSKAIYFDIKDEACALPCCCFDDSIFKGVNFGEKVLLTGRLNFYSKTGKLSFVVSKVEKFGVGELYQKYLELKEKLEKEGLFSSDRKKELPICPKRVGIVTSDTGAVINDIIRVAREKNKSTDIVLYPVKVQGTSATKEIISGIEFFNNYNIDLIIVARGGGSFEDYAPFNTEELARAVFCSQKPVVSAIGHENDWSIIDFVADARASTPSVASEMVFFDEIGFTKSAVGTVNKFYNYITSKIVTMKGDMVDNLKNIGNITQNRIIKSGNQIKLKIQNISNLFDYSYLNLKNSLNLVLSRIEKQNPILILKKGFAKINKNGSSISSIKDLNIEDNIDVNLIDGTATAKICRIEEK